jgi:hypothetical protein
MWCIFEIFRCLALGIDVTAVVSPEDAESIHAFVKNGGELMSEVVHIDAECATASVPTDKENISRTIKKTVGFDEVSGLQV